MTYKSIKFPPLTKEEIKGRYKEAKEEMEEILKWKNEEEEKLKSSKNPRAKSAAIRALKKVDRRINTVKGNILYWNLRQKGSTHFRANLERHELWAKLQNQK